MRSARFSWNGRQTRAVDDVADRDLIEILPGEKIMGAGQGAQPRGESVALLARAFAEGLRGDGLHRAQRVLHPVLDFVQQQVAGFLGALAFGDVARDLGGADDLAAGRSSPAKR